MIKMFINKEFNRCVVKPLAIAVGSVVGMFGLALLKKPLK